MGPSGPRASRGLDKDIFFRSLKALRAIIYHLLGPVDIFDPRVWLKNPKTTKIGYKLLAWGPFGLTFVKND